VVTSGPHASVSQARERRGTPAARLRWLSWAGPKEQRARACERGKGEREGELAGLATGPAG
jgi:hypothetical protein